MKKRIILFSAVCLAASLLFWACEKNTDVPTQESTSFNETETTDRGGGDPVPICNCSVTLKVTRLNGSPLPAGSVVTIRKRPNCSAPLCPPDGTTYPIVTTVTNSNTITFKGVGCLSCYTAIGTIPDTQAPFQGKITITNINGSTVFSPLPFTDDGTCDGTNVLGFSASATCDAN